MKIIDANIILRYLLEDVPELSKKASEILETNEVFIPSEVFAEIVYVLEKVYEVEREEISSTLIELINTQNINVTDRLLLKKALEFYSATNFDFIDTILYSYNKYKHYKVFSFDKKLSKLLT